MREPKKHAIDRSALKQNEPQETVPLEAVTQQEEKPEEIRSEQIVPPEISETPQTDPVSQPKKRVKRKGHGKTILILVVVVILLAATCFKIYIDNDYEPLHSREEYQTLTEVEIEFSDNVIAIQDMEQPGENWKTGFIFYGDERIQRESYLPLMAALANMGYSVFLPTTFGNIPILNLEGAEYVSRTYPSVKTWYIVAHGKACPVAAKYASSHSTKIKGLVYLGGYSNTDLSNKTLRLLSVTASNDSIMDRKEFQNAKANDPKDTVYLEIEGGNHTGFTDTKLIRKDSPAAISSEEQIRFTALAIQNFVTAP
ncbi:MAG: hypothetical protein IKZ95_04440 [Lachnospiraceae bacterium]|nr:hypothetical protein [Lachnospiraceae bacterium]